MEEFFDKYINLIRFVLYGIAILISLVIAFLVVQTSSVWSGALGELWSGMMPFLIAFLLAYIIHPLISWIEKLKIPRVLAIFLFYGLVFGSLVIGMVWLLPKLIKETYELGQNLPYYLVAVEEQLLVLEQYLGFDISGELISESSSWMTSISENFQSLSLWLFDFIFYFIGSLAFILIVPIALFYFLMDYEKIVRLILKLVPEKYRHDVSEIAVMLDDTLGVYIRGLLLIMLIMTLIGSLLLFIFGFNYALLFGAIMGITALIPVVGPVIGTIPAVIFGLSLSWHHVLVAILIQVFLQIIEGNVLRPLIIGRKLEMHPLLIMMLMLVVGKAFGMAGVLFAIPVYLFIRTIRDYLKKN